ncbi:MAG: 4-alpha-glucanotransferase, partial [Gammaproteobacteria bacterium]|nr:4-alpha-glucanotransferase [Gammaproteobacteria bacterium]
GHSPYQPLSVFAGNPLLIDLGDLVELELLRAEDLGASDRLGDRGSVDSRAVGAVKLPLLELAADRFAEAGDAELEKEYERFCADNDRTWLDAFAAFCLLKSQHGSAPWSDWGIDFRTLDIPNLAERQPKRWQRIKRIQFLFARQWRALRAEAAARDIVLFGDVPIYMSLDCAEAWAHPDLLNLDANGAPLDVAGVPPDYFSADGQLWGNPTYRWDAHAADGYRWWVARLTHALEQADLVRLDHFRAFESYWSVPADAETARDGQWRAGPGRALFDALRDAIGSAPLVAEDLGLITDEVRALRQVLGLPGMQVLQFLVDQPQFSIEWIEENCICYTGTHDNDTSEGWYAGSGGAMAGDALARWQETVRQNLDQVEQGIHKAMISLAFRSRARIAIAPLQDYFGLGSAARFNTPGTARGNWRWRTTEAELNRADTRYIEDFAAASHRL